MAAFTVGTAEFVCTNMQIRSITSERASFDSSLASIRFGVSGLEMLRKIEFPAHVAKFSKNTSFTIGYKEFENGKIQPGPDVMINGRDGRGRKETFMARKFNFTGTSDLSDLWPVYPSNLFAENRRMKQFSEKPKRKSNVPGRN